MSQREKYSFYIIIIDATCKFTCAQNEDIWGTVVYAFFSSLCKSALHDFRISLWNTSERTFLFKQSWDATFYGSNRLGFSSKTHAVQRKIRSYKFFSPYISESILDIVSLHRGYLFEEKANHTQECFVFGKYPNIKFSMYNKKKNSKLTVIETMRAEVFFTKAIWAERRNMKKPNAGFLCSPENNTLSTVTSLAFRNNAYFYPSKFTITVNVNETVTLSMKENEIHEEYSTEWKKDEVDLNDDGVRPQSVGRTSVTFSDTQVGYSGIYSLEYRNYDIKKRGYMRLIVRACPSGKYGNLCDKTCPQCLNGGICHDIIGTCICPPGFSGPTCENVCNPGYFGRNCNMKCALDSKEDKQSCKGVLMCLPDPYGCSCAAGFTGILCDKTCRSGTYGAGCSEKRNCHCANGTNCDVFTGLCNEGCDNNWHGKHCDERLVGVKDVSFKLISSFAANLTWEKPPELNMTVRYYIISYQQIGWRYHCNFSFDDNLFVKNTTETCLVLDNLNPFAIYTMNVKADVVILSENSTFNYGIKSEVVINTSATAPTPSILFHAAFKTTSSLYFVWASPLPFGGLLDHHKLSYKDDENNSTDFKSIVINASKSQCSIKGSVHCWVLKDLTPNHTYDVQLRAFNKDVNNGSQAIIYVARTLNSDPISKFKVLILERKNKEVIIQILPDNEFARFFRAFFIVVDVIDSTNSHQNLSNYINKKANCHSTTSDTYIAAKIHAVPENGIKFTVGNRSCLNGYFNPPLKNGKKYRIGIAALISYCKDESFTKILFADETVSINVFKASHSKFLNIALGFLLPLTVIISILVVLLCINKTKSFKASAMKKRFIPKIDPENEFAACNEALDEMDIIETESICEELSNCISIDELQRFVKNNMKNNTIKKEFLSLPKGQMYPCSVAKLPDSKFKNRYGNILPYDHTLVNLKTTNGSDYVHANFIDGYKDPHRYIATQGPMVNTVTDFWYMAWQEKVSKIIMIANVIETGKCKCEKYWTDNTSSFGEIKLILENEELFADFVIRTFTISKGHKSKEIKQFHFTSWPDHGVPFNTTPFINFLMKVRTYDVHCSSPIVVHCSAGIGRTGTVILFENAFEMSIQENQIDVLGLLFSMRKQRMNIVENYDQYTFVYHALVEALCIENTCTNSVTFLKKYSDLIKPYEETGMTRIRKQFQMLNDLPVQLLPKDIFAAYMVSNQAKNRNMHILPSDRARPILKSSSKTSDYINAVYIDSYRHKNMFVATEYPLPETVIDFWRMVFEVKSKIIILLQSIPFSNEDYPLFWPAVGSQIFGQFHVEIESIIDENDVIFINLLVTLKNPQEENSPVPIKLIHIKSWDIKTYLPRDTSTILTVMKFLNVYKNNCTNDAIIMTCQDGVTACGVFCAFLYTIDYMEAEQGIDIFQSVKCTRTNRMQFIVNVEQYEFLFQLMKDYLESLSFTG
ncbi:receptor-type tyrosine-protein phosphatase T [Caerostris darwini]|uniref:protein-tyrosine-phosphatase n=1 Tax=Caerostris darwini TaxID=1538125 RepID=A0AAV4W2U9_9ARAC|nr:receptor-type tyrosine-protein phosphatase T [Caerostris darwini]